MQDFLTTAQWSKQYQGRIIFIKLEDAAKNFETRNFENYKISCIKASSRSLFINQGTSNERHDITKMKALLVLLSATAALASHSAYTPSPPSFPVTSLVFSTC
jgi:hypothetical protein